MSRPLFQPPLSPHHGVVAMEATNHDGTCHAAMRRYGKSLYKLTDPERRPELLRHGWKDVAKVFLGAGTLSNDRTEHHPSLFLQGQPAKLPVCVSMNAFLLIVIGYQIGKAEVTGLDTSSDSAV